MTHRYVVEGRGHFPHDMLRYDRATLLDEEGDPSETRRLRVEGATRPTPERWASFGWTVYPAQARTSRNPPSAPSTSAVQCVVQSPQL